MFWFFFLFISTKDIYNYKKLNFFNFKGIYYNLLYYLLGTQLKRVYLSKSNDVFLHLKKSSFLLNFYILKNKLNFKSLVDILSYDLIWKKKRFFLLYNLINFQTNFRINVVLNVKEFDFVPTLNKVFMSSNWSEREIWDMHGVYFSNHVNLNRILTDYGFKGNPLKKDFPLSGYKEVYYDDLRKRILNVKISLAQEYRNFTFSYSNW